MKGSRVLVAVLAVLCVAAMASADVIDTTCQNYANIGGYRDYTEGLGIQYVGDWFFYAQYGSPALTAALADPNVAIVSASFVYSRGYTNNPSIQNTTTICEPIADYTQDNVSHNSAFHFMLIGSNSNETPQFTGNRFSLPTPEAVITPGGADPYAGTHAVDVTAIIQDWKNGAANYGYSLGMMSKPQNFKLSFGAFMPYLEVVTAPVPEPATMCLLVVGGIATLLRRRSKA